MYDREEQVIIARAPWIGLVITLDPVMVDGGGCVGKDIKGSNRVPVYRMGALYPMILWRLRASELRSLAGDQVCEVEPDGGRIYAQ